MTRYEQGFLTKCAEYGVPAEVAGRMLKVAQTAPAGTPDYAHNPPPPMVSDGKARVDTSEMGYDYLPAPNGNVDYLGGTTPIQVPVSGGTVNLPYGSSSLTNNTGFVSFTPDKGKGRTRLTPMWYNKGQRYRGDGNPVVRPVKGIPEQLLAALAAGGGTPYKPPKGK